MWSFQDRDLFKLVLVLVLLGMFAGWVVFGGLPMLWDVVKPWIHEVTA